jgi:hypothetical protein
MYHFAHIAAYYQHQGRSLRGLGSLEHLAHVAKYYRIKRR